MFKRLISDLRTPWSMLTKFGDGKLYHNAQYLTAVVEVNEKAMAPWLPSGMKLAKPGRADLFLACFPDNVYTGEYHEAGLFVHVKVGRGYGIFCPWMILDDDRALIIGRELLGYPKKQGEISWDDNGERIVAKATRRGSTLIDMEAKFGEVLKGAPPILGHGCGPHCGGGHVGNSGQSAVRGGSRERATGASTARAGGEGTPDRRSQLAARVAAAGA